MYITDMNIGIASLPAPNMDINGDSYLIKKSTGQILLTVIDGLGHGEEAFEASDKAKKFIESNAKNDIKNIILDLDRQLLNTRGVVIGLVKIDLLKKILYYCGIGNIDIRIVSEPHIYTTFQGGIVGTGLRGTHICQREYRYDNIGLVILHSDGISNRFKLSDYPLVYREPQKVADQIIKDFRRINDDATIMITTFDSYNGKYYH